MVDVRDDGLELHIRNGIGGDMYVSGVLIVNGYVLGIEIPNDLEVPIERIPTANNNKG